MLQAFDDAGKFDPSVHGTTGPVGITLSNFVYDTAKALIAAAGSVAGFEFREDPNAGNMLGISWATMNQGVSLQY